MLFIYYKDFKTPNITLFGALAGQIQHTAAQKVRFTPRLLRQVAITDMLQAQLLVSCIEIYIAELSLNHASYSRLP
jgi:hypothetical protein